MDAIWETIPTWRESVEKHLGKGCKNMAVDIVINIILVDIGIKRGYLLDVGLPSVVSLTSFLTYLCENQIVKHHLNVIVIDMDIVIVKPGTFLSSISHDEHPMLVNASAALAKSEPSLSDDNSILTNIVKAFQTCEFDPSCVKTHYLNTADLNLSTCFGLCIGYPVVYWFDQNHDGHQDTCLANLPLKCYKVTGQKTFPCSSQSDKLYHTIYSFSVPQCLHSKVDEKIQNWLDILTKHVNECAMFDQVGVSVECVQLDTVLL